MKRLAMLVVAGMMGLLLVACGDNAPKQPAATEVGVEQPAAAAPEAASTETTSTETTTSEDAAPADAQTQE